MTELTVHYDVFEVIFYLSITIIIIFLLCLGFVLWIFRDYHREDEEPVCDPCEIDPIDYSKVEEDLR